MSEVDRPLTQEELNAMAAQVPAEQVAAVQSLPAPADPVLQQLQMMHARLDALEGIVNDVLAFLHNMHGSKIAGLIAKPYALVGAALRML